MLSVPGFNSHKRKGEKKTGLGVIFIIRMFRLLVGFRLFIKLLILLREGQECSFCSDEQHLAPRRRLSHKPVTQGVVSPHALVGELESYFVPTALQEAGGETSS